MIFNYITTFLFFILTLTVHSQTDTSRLFLGESVAKAELSDAIANSKYHKANTKPERLEDKQKAIEYAEKIVFKKYGKRHIIDQRPYESYLIDNYWVIKGTLPLNYEGGTFLIILDSKDGRVLRLTHGQ